ncbi:MAG: prephenate dehydratase [Bacteroidetes bacterium GWF2_42_66]|nr:MAG: prephenate dehydratase [Bacteroidetes bacterium GWA2_42_15]OFY01518.1 MAG: prephenate dehydratase [Bacteroidetes bacterium GWE2_42_39]OFY43301.1 MAG: prephenate dehydratase [Bacteroidetes bacterium GWF2_42_66]HBL77516.1 prephenate dehydratase [Prolixibacteraceae bacterium]HCR90743.1 prephenate dehydratase [Prolixibacteraceae bacterium]
MKKIAIQGIAGSFHEDAARKYFGDEEIEVIECRSFQSVCELIDADKVDIAVMAIENSIAGSILQNYSLIRDFHLRVIGEIYIHIQMNLMMLPGAKKEDIKTIYSHPIAIRQCVEYIEKYFPEAKIRENQDTAASGKLLVEENLMNAAAIGNLRTAEIYGLNVLETNIETNKKNYTRFWILSKHSNQSDLNNKASLCFEVGHYYGALARVLNIFAENKINLNKIQSVPILGKPNEYTMHVDVEWDDIVNYERAIHAILKNVSSLSILGEYVRGEIDIQN